jgi:hypothetical protein
MLLCEKFTIKTMKRFIFFISALSLLFATSPTFGQSKKHKTHKLGPVYKNVAPINSIAIAGEAMFFDTDVNQKSCPISPCKLTDSLDVQLIKLLPGHKDSILVRMNRLGFVPAPANYVLGIATQYRQDFLKKTVWIVSIDTNNMVPKFDKTKKQEFIYVELKDHTAGATFIDINAGIKSDFWWFAVVKKS